MSDIQLNGGIIEEEQKQSYNPSPKHMKNLDIIEEEGHDEINKS